LAWSFCQPSGIVHEAGGRKAWQSIPFLMRNDWMSSRQSRNCMSTSQKTVLKTLDAAQAVELSLLVELEAWWENLRKTPSRTQERASDTRTLAGAQKAYDAFRGKLAAYNKQYTPAHVPELLLNTPSRLAGWCRAMQQLYLQVEHAPQALCPRELLEKAYRWADRISDRLNKERISRPGPPAAIRTAIENLGVLVKWCENLASGAAPAPPELAAPP
jgi:hypothetical protein